LRIVSLVPSLSHTVCELGLKDQLVGCTNFCVLPAGLHRSATLIGGTKDPDLAKIASLKPTHIIVNEEENKPKHIAACEEICPVLQTFPRGPADTPALFSSLAAFLGSAAADKTAEECRLLLDHIGKTNIRLSGGKSFLYFIWRSPYMLVGRDTYISRMLELAGLENAYQGPERYPSVTTEECQEMNADLLLLSSEPFPFRKRHAKELRQAWQMAPPIYKVDGQLWSWYGSLTVKALHALAQSRGVVESHLLTRFE